MLGKVVLFIALSAVAFANPPEHHHHAQPYKFGYEIKDHHGSQHRHEHGDGHGHVQGSYGFTDDRGIHREVHYTADHNGFKAQVKTNEPGTSNQNPASVQLHSSAQHIHHHDSHHSQGHHHDSHHSQGHQHGHQKAYHHQAHPHGHHESHHHGHNVHGHHHGHQHVYHHQTHPHGHN